MRGLALWNILRNLQKYQGQFSSTIRTITTEYARALARTNTMFCAGFFIAENIFNFFLKSCNKSHLAVQIWCGKRDTYFSLHSERGCDFETIRLPKDNTMSV